MGTDLHNSIKTAEDAAAAMIDRDIEQLTSRFQEESDLPFEFVMLSKTYHLNYNGKGKLPTFKKENSPKECTFIESIQSLDNFGNYQMITRAIADSAAIQRELEKIEIPII